MSKRQPKIIKIESYDQYRPIYMDNGRYVIEETKSGKIMDDCQGYGYKTKESAWKGFKYKYKTQEELDKHNEMNRKQEIADKWFSEHPDFLNFFDEMVFITTCKDMEDWTHRDTYRFIKNYFEVHPELSIPGNMSPKDFASCIFRKR